jgi:hypothetical protein
MGTILMVKIKNECFVSLSLTFAALIMLLLIGLYLVMFPLKEMEREIEYTNDMISLMPYNPDLSQKEVRN